MGSLDILASLSFLRYPASVVIESSGMKMMRGLDSSTGVDGHMGYSWYFPEQAGGQTIDTLPRLK